MAKHAASVRKNASSQVATHSTGPNDTFKCDEAEILARGDNRVSRELLDSWFSGPQSSNKRNDPPVPYLALILCLGKAVSQAESVRMTTVPGVNVGEPNSPRVHPDAEIWQSAARLRAMSVGADNLDQQTGVQQLHTAMPGRSDRDALENCQLSPMMDSCDNPKHRANKTLVPAIVSPSLRFTTRLDWMFYYK